MVPHHKLPDDDEEDGYTFTALHRDEGWKVGHNSSEVTATEHGRGYRMMFAERVRRHGFTGLLEEEPSAVEQYREHQVRGRMKLLVFAGCLAIWIVMILASVWANLNWWWIIALGFITGLAKGTSKNLAAAMEHFGAMEAISFMGQKPQRQGNRWGSISRKGFGSLEITFARKKGVDRDGRPG